MVLRTLLLGSAGAGALELALVEVPEAWSQRLFLVVLCALVAVPAAFAKPLARRPKEVALFAASTAVALGAVVAFEGPLVRRMVSPLYSLDVDHRMADCGHCFAGNGVATREQRGIDPADFNVVFLGDSFAYGDKLPDELDSFPFLVEGLAPAPIRVANFAWPSSSPLLQLRQLRDIGAAYAPDLVIVAFDVSDFQDDLIYRSQLDDLAEPWSLSVFRVAEVRLGLALGVSDLREWLRQGLRWTGPDSPGQRRLLSREHRHYAMNAPLADNVEPMEVTWRYLLSLHQEAEALGASFAVVVLPRYQHYHPQESPTDWARIHFPTDHTWIFEPFAWFEAKARTAPFPIHSLLAAFQATEELQTVWLDDPHYSEAGHRVAAADLTAWLVEEGLVPRGPTPRD